MAAELVEEEGEAVIPWERKVWQRVRAASLDELIGMYREEVEGPHNGVEDVMAQRWVGLSIRGELLRRWIDPAILDVPFGSDVLELFWY